MDLIIRDFFKVEIIGKSESFIITNCLKENFCSI